MTALLLSLSLLLAENGEERPAVLVVVGAPGTDDYAKQFRQWAARWRQAADRGGAEFAAIGLEKEGETGDRELLRQCLAERGRSSPAALWLVLIGHGTFDGKTAKFNLRGPDFSASELAEWIKPVERPLAIVNCASASGPFLNALSGPNRIVITATKSGHEHNFARFGDYLSAAIADPKADLDKDDQTSLLEAFLLAAARVEEFYKEETRLATEHALIDDNGDRLGTPADWFRGLRATKVAQDGASIDGLRAGQLQLVASQGEQDLPAAARLRRDALELEIAELRRRKDAIAADEYYRALEPLLLELARLYEPVDQPPTIEPPALDGD
jgi:hypothetical protein